jgi:lipid-binding SYLF domain-containing protein
MEKYIRNARKTMQCFIDPNQYDDSQIPHAVLKKAKGIAFISEIKAGFTSGMFGAGIVLARKRGTNQWSGPIAIGTGGPGWSGHSGHLKSRAVIVLNSFNTVRVFATQSQVNLGRDLSIAAGPIGIFHPSNESAACFSYSQSGGLFAGISLDGLVIVSLAKDNHKFYNSTVAPKDILFEDVQPPHNTDMQLIYETLNKFQFKGNWMDEETENTENPAVDSGFSREHGQHEEPDRGLHDTHDQGLSTNEYDKGQHGFGQEHGRPDGGHYVPNTGSSGDSSGHSGPHKNLLGTPMDKTHSQGQQPGLENEKL